MLFRPFWEEDLFARVFTFCEKWSSTFPLENVAMYIHVFVLSCVRHLRFHVRALAISDALIQTKVLQAVHIESSCYFTQTLAYSIKLSWAFVQAIRWDLTFNDIVRNLLCYWFETVLRYIGFIRIKKCESRAFFFYSQCI